MSIRAIASAIVLGGTLGLGSASAMPLDALKTATEAVQQTENAGCNGDSGGRAKVARQRGL